MIQKIFTINRLADPVCIDVCTRPRKKVSKTSSNTLVNGTQTGLCLGGGLGIHPRGVLRQLLLWLLYVYIINIHTLRTHTHTYYPDLFHPPLYSASFYPILND